jgi:hypothetical protein
MTRRLLFAAAALTAACSGGPEADFTADRSAVSCNSAIPVCTTYAGCSLDETNYVAGSFSQGPAVRFLVHTGGPATISVELYFTSEQSPGVDTEVTWYESACASSTTQASDGADVFAEAGANMVWKRSQQVTTEGDHLVELFSDAQASYLLRVEIQTGS